VANPRLETMSREVFRHPDLAPLVELNRIRDHFICMCPRRVDACRRCLFSVQAQQPVYKGPLYHACSP
jgi:hypothetical protein